jgi:hypothetical protein
MVRHNELPTADVVGGGLMGRVDNAGVAHDSELTGVLTCGCW